jgi:hypothetical protein
LLGRPLPGTNCFISVDGTDFRILEPVPFDRKWYSHKINGPGLRYEIGMCISTGHIVWAHGGLPCGEWPDLRLSRDALIYFMSSTEKALADKGYRDKNYFVYSCNESEFRAEYKKIMAWHETVNRRLKKFGVLQCRFRHELHLHPRCFHAVVNLTQLMIENGEPLFQVQFNDI